MRISKSTKTSVKASSSSLKFTGKTWKELIKNIESSGRKVDSVDKSEPADFITIYDGRGNEYEAEVTHYSDGTYELMRDNICKVGSVNACGDVKGSTSTDKALQHIKAAIDILGKSGKKDAVTKDSIANLATVMFDIKASTDSCKYSKNECINAIQAEYGYNKKEAENYYKKTDCKTLEALVEGFKANAKKSFYED